MINMIELWAIENRGILPLRKAINQRIATRRNRRDTGWRRERDFSGKTEPKDDGNYQGIIKFFCHDNLSKKTERHKDKILREKIRKYEEASLGEVFSLFIFSRDRFIISANGNRHGRRGETWQWSATDVPRISPGLSIYLIIIIN